MIQRRNYLVILFCSISLMFSISSCSTIKSTDSNNFTRVKYNPHFKIKKRNSPVTVKRNKIEKLSPAMVSEINVKPKAKDTKKVVFSKVNDSESNVSRQNLTTENDNNAFESVLFSMASDKKEGLDFINNWTQLLPASSNSLAPPAEQVDVESLVWIILVVLLVLLILSILAELGGGLIGTLLGVLLILLILRLLGII